MKNRSVSKDINIFVVTGKSKPVLSKKAKENFLKREKEVDDKIKKEKNN